MLGQETGASKEDGERPVAAATSDFNPKNYEKPSTPKSSFAKWLKTCSKDLGRICLMPPMPGLL